VPTLSYSFKTTWPVNPAQCFGHPFLPIPSITANSDLPSVDQVCWQVRQNQTTRYMEISCIVELRGASQTEGTMIPTPSVVYRLRRVAK
jgi:hypothetical protein